MTDPADAMTRLDIAESTLMAIRPIAADYLGTSPWEKGWIATVREVDGTERNGVGPTKEIAVRALITWYADARLKEYAMIYADGQAWDDDGPVDLSL